MTTRESRLFWVIVGSQDDRQADLQYDDAQPAHEPEQRDLVAAMTRVHRHASPEAAQAP